MIASAVVYVLGSGSLLWLVDRRMKAAQLRRERLFVSGHVGVR